ncbi:MAG: Flp pilus assembly complex ATPase component TadA [Candidatus Doudnabacteria bacterium]|nr:Flp pilus assembly complex ATPase component TadA [Candidatus Doudnabacteria bacterium]
MGSMNMEGIKLKEILLKGDYVSSADFAQAEKYSQSHHATVLEYLLNSGLLTKELLGQAIAENFGVPFTDLSSSPPSRQQVAKIPEQIAREYLVVLAKEDEKKIVVSTNNPNNSKLLKSLKEIFPTKNITVSFSFSEDIEQCFSCYNQPLEARFVRILEHHQHIAPKILEEIFKDALIYRASDIHFEPREKEVLTRFRIDGVLQEVGKLPIAYYENILNRIKVQARMKIDEHLSAQDGALQFIQDGVTIDARVSVVPTLNGEKVVMRLLSEYVKTLSLSDLGLSSKNLNQLSESAKLPFGMILVTGPTGSGKTTTLYALLKTLDNPDINITSIEDPVEYRVTSMNQIQVNSATNLTFAKGLRSIVRQDPDIILVGEIRDKDTAEVAVNAALTGHLLFSTFHANDAATAIPRLIDIGVEPYLAASTLNLIISQRLLRRICENCRFSQTILSKTLIGTIKDLKKYFPETKTTLYKGKGCSACNFTGYKGRIGIFELIILTKELRDLIIISPSSQDIWKLAKKQNARTLFEDGIEKVKAGVSTLEELLRVSPPA